MDNDSENIPLESWNLHDNPDAKLVVACHRDMQIEEALANPIARWSLCHETSTEGRFTHRISSAARDLFQRILEPHRLLIRAQRGWGVNVFVYDPDDEFDPDSLCEEARRITEEGPGTPIDRFFRHLPRVGGIDDVRDYLEEYSEGDAWEAAVLIKEIGRAHV